jgi:predicted lipid-binding transport protein (Tim44 family)
MRCELKEASVLSRWLTLGRCLLGACVLAFATGASGGSAAQIRPGAAQTPPRPAAAGAPSHGAAQASPRESTQATAPATPAPVRSRWLAPLAGLAAGLGLAALADRLGFGPNLAPVLILLMLGVLVSAVALAARRARPASAPASPYGESWQGIGGPSYAPRPATLRVDPRAAGRSDTAQIGGPADARELAGARRPFGVPPDFDTSAFLVGAQQSFVRLQTAWDRADLQELGECTTDEMFNALTHELRVRAGPSRTEVIDLTASLLGIEAAAGEHRASVRFCGNLKVNGEDERLDEVWGLSKVVDGSSGWLLAGIQQLN